MSDQRQYQVALALGSNMGDRLAALRMAVEKLATYIDITAKSSIYETAPAYVSDQPAFLNAVILGTTILEPLSLLWVVKDLESDIGRTPTFRYGPRVIDIDIILHSAGVVTTTELCVPHPRLPERDFVLKPLCDVAPDWAHPVTGKTPVAMLASLPPDDMKIFGEQW